MAGELKKLLRLPKYLAGSIQYHLAGVFFTAKPRMIQFPVCDRCNARCIMCNRWRKDPGTEIGIEKIREVFHNPLFSKVEQVNLHGGEPTLRPDLAEICHIIQEGCPRLRQIWISTNGFGTKRIQKRVLEILRILDLKRIPQLDINVSIDGIGETHDRIRGVRGGFDQAVNTLRDLKELARTHPVSLTIGTVIQPLNVKQLDELESFARSLEIPVLFQPLMFDDFFNLDDCENLRFTAEDDALFQAAAERLSSGCSPAAFYWRDYLGMKQGRRRQSPCAFDRYILSLYPTGEILPCSRKDWILFGNVFDEPVDRIWYSRKADAVRKRVKREVCPSCSEYCAVEFSLQKEFAAYFRYYLRWRLSKRAARRPL